MTRCAMEIKKQQGESIRSSTQDFIQKAIKIHFDKNGPFYIIMKTHVTIKCRNNHIF